MSPAPSAPELVNLGPRGVHAFTAAQPLTVCVSRGSVWVTLDNDGRDIVLEPGESFAVPAGRRVVVYAFEVSLVALRPAEAAAAAHLPRHPPRTTAQVTV